MGTGDRVRRVLLECGTEYSFSYLDTDKGYFYQMLNVLGSFFFTPCPGALDEQCLL